MRDFSPPELWKRASGSDDRSGQSGLPHSLNGSFQGGDWVVQPWSRGICDDTGASRWQRNPANDSTGTGSSRSYQAVLEGGVGPSDWRLPHIGMEPRSSMVVHGSAQTGATMEIPRSSNVREI
ncbi:hypothetical protein D1007_20643 [Hordeum vulgare]|nr:hypothetical protein D1007_20643 [Hordeum vulgare]